MIEGVDRISIGLILLLGSNLLSTSCVYSFATLLKSYGFTNIATFFFLQIQL